MIKTNKLIALATVSAIALSTPVMADMKEAMMGSLKESATTQVETSVGAAKSEMTKTVVKSTAHSVGITGSDATIDKAVDGYDKMKKVQALPEGSTVEIAKDAAGKMATGQDMTSSVTEAVDAKMAPKTSATTVISDLKEAGQNELKKSMGLETNPLAEGTTSEMIKKVADETPAVEDKSSIWNSVKSIFN